MDIRVPSFPRQIVEVLGGLNPVVLIPLMGDLSRTVNSGVGRSRTLAAALQASPPRGRGPPLFPPCTRGGLRGALYQYRRAGVP